MYMSPWEKTMHDRIDEMSLAEKVKRFFEILDVKEISDNDREFSPVYISCCRCLTGAELSYMFKKMKEEI